MSEPISDAVPQGLADALRDEEQSGGNRREGRVASFSVLFLAALALVIGLVVRPEDPPGPIDPALKEVVSELEAGLQTADPQLRTDLVQKAFCTTSSGAGAAAMLENIPPLSSAAANAQGRVPWVSLTLDHVVVDGATAAGTLTTRYNQKELPGTPLPEDVATIPVAFSYAEKSWCIR